MTEKPCDHFNTEMGYGLAGGGIGTYEYCLDCDKMINKVQDLDCGPIDCSWGKEVK